MSRLPVDPIARPTLSIEEGGRLCGLGRSKSCVEARRFIETNGSEGLPALSFGRAMRCPTMKLLEVLGFNADATNGDGAFSD